MNIFRKAERLSIMNGIGRRRSTMNTIYGVRGSATVVMDYPLAAILVVSVQSERFSAHDIGRKPCDLLEKFGFAEIDFF